MNIHPDQRPLFDEMTGENRNYFKDIIRKGKSVPVAKGSETSAEAAEIVKKTLPARCIELLKYMQKHREPIGPDELAEKVGMSFLWTRPRFSDTLKPFIRKVDNDGKTCQGNRQSRFVLKEKYLEIDFSNTELKF